MWNSLLSLAIVAAVVVPSVGTVSASYDLLDRSEDFKFTRYEYSDRLSNRFVYDGYLYASPYRTVTHALHPFYRNSYNQQNTNRPQRRITSPEFYKYLEDLYYGGYIGEEVPMYSIPYEPSPSSRCMNYSTRSASQRSPGRIVSCN